MGHGGSTRKKKKKKRETNRPLIGSACATTIIQKQPRSYGNRIATYYYYQTCQDTCVCQATYLSVDAICQGKIHMNHAYSHLSSSRYRMGLFKMSVFARPIHRQYRGPRILPQTGTLVNPFRAAVPLWGQTTQISSRFSSKRDCGSKGVNSICAKRLRRHCKGHRQY